DVSMTAADESYAALQKAIASGDQVAIEAARDRFERRVGGAHDSIEDHRRAVDSVTDKAVMIAGAAAGIAVIVVSGGTLTPAVVAAAAAATAGTGIVVKTVMLGHAYGAEAIGTDVAVGAVNVGAAVLTAGVGNVLLRTSALARLAAAGWVGRVGASVLAEGVQNALAGVPAGMAGAMLDDNTWRSNDPLGIIAEAAGMAGGMGAATGAAFSLAGQAVQAGRSAVRTEPAAGAHAGTGTGTAGGEPTARVDAAGSHVDTAATATAQKVPTTLAELGSVPSEALGESPIVRTAEQTGPPTTPVHERPTQQLTAVADPTGPATTPVHERPTQQTTAVADPTVAVAEPTGPRPSPASERITESMTGVPDPAATGPEPVGPEPAGAAADRPGPAVDRTAAQEQLDKVTGVDKGSDYAARQAELREFYENQQVEAANSTDVRAYRVDQMVDAAGNPMNNWDNTPYGYGIMSGFEVRTFDYGPGGKLTEVTMKVRLEGKAGVTPEQLLKMQEQTHAGVDAQYNNGRKLPGGERLHVRVEFVDDPALANLNVEVLPGRGATVQNRWFTGDNETTFAHELGHQLGFLDEYVDPKTVWRPTAQSPGVRHDNSLMGDFWLKDANGNVVLDANKQPMVNPKTTLHQRHLDQLGRDIDAARAYQAAAQANGTPHAAPAPEPGSYFVEGADEVVPHEAGPHEGGAPDGPSPPDPARTPAPADPAAPAADRPGPAGAAEGASPGRVETGAVDPATVGAATDAPPVQALTDTGPAPGPAGSQAEAVQRLVAKAEAMQAELGQRLVAVRQEVQQAQTRIRELNGELTRRGVDLRGLDSDVRVARLPDDVRALVAERAELIGDTQYGIAEAARIGREQLMWRRAASSDIVRTRYAELRGRTPDGAARARVAAETVDVVGRPNTPENPFRPDHLVPVMDIVAMDNFVMLPDPEALAILNMAENLVPLNAAANSSKSDWGWAEWPQADFHADAATKAAMIERELALRQQIYDRIQSAFARTRGR
ncbi:MAG TPA: hypothetical protein VMU51_04210, partial [Mycobacteriales bacterium]|nr:hypothetical protein [Mycobacteriales bacterium]